MIDQKIEESFAEANLLLKNEKKKLIDELADIGAEVGKNNVSVLKLLSQFANKLGDERTISLG